MANEADQRVDCWRALPRTKEHTLQKDKWGERRNSHAQNSTITATTAIVENLSNSRGDEDTQKSDEGQSTVEKRHKGKMAAETTR